MLLCWKWLAKRSYAKFIVVGRMAVSSSSSSSSLMKMNSEEEFPTSARKANGRFCLPWSNEERPSLPRVLYHFRTCPDSPNIPSQKVLDTIEEMKIVEPQYDVINDPPSPQQHQSVQLTWLGHAGFLVQLGGFNVLFDPVFSESIGPVQMFGNKRFRTCPLSVQQLPRIDLVCISHDHYDHLDKPTVVALNKRFGASLKWCVPLGMDDWLESVVGKNVDCRAFDWWQNFEHKGETSETLQVEYVPAQHWCLRGNAVRNGWLKFSTDENTRLWGGWVIKANGMVVYHAGDTGYQGNIFKSIGKKHGPIDVALIPIGAYSPRAILKFQHVNPEEAVMVHQDVQAKHSVGMHWGTFALSNEYFLEPAIKLKEALEKYKLSEDEFITMKHGETKVFYKEQVEKNTVNLDEALIQPTSNCATTEGTSL